ncbi:MAG: exodeoxyribonuclease V subunit gamma [Verrucomicrobia bacterium]|nr:exodeoxyribonuclease V subunit gamma [Verrucomicrobiota bacterium]
MIHFSNSLEELLQILKENLYPERSGPFDRRLIAVPHLGLKSYLMQSIAKDPDLQVAAGLQIVNLTQAWSKMCRKKLPTTLELSLFLEHQLISIIDEEGELQDYFSSASRERRIGPLCDTLALYFQRYAIYGKKKLCPWQEKLWKGVKRRWSFPGDVLEVKGEWQVHLFGFSLVPKVYFNFFESANFYLFSPCEIYWEDFYSEKEKSYLKIDDRQNPMLENWGKVGRKMFTMVQESNLCTEEHYRRVDEKCTLGLLQNDCLEGNHQRHFVDDSLYFFSASTPLREIEILKDQLLKLFTDEKLTPRDVQVFAPDISRYAPYIHAVFGDLPYGISDLQAKEVDDVVRAFAKFIELPKKRFALEDVLQLFSTAPFKAKWDLNLTQVRKWLELANIRWGFSKNERRTFYLQDIDEEHLSANPEEGTWEVGLRRLVLGLGQIEGEALCAIEVTEMEQFDRLYQLLYSLSDDLTPFYDGTTWTIPTWLRYFATLLESYFEIDPSHDLYQQLQQLAASCDQLDREEIPYCAVERVLEQLISKKGKSHQPPHLQAISFGSLLEGCILPGKVICLIGMAEESFPAREENGSLYAGEIDYRPKQGDQDRYLFLQSLLSASAHFICSYVRDEAGKLGASQVVLELIGQIEGAKIIHHPALAFHQSYFNNELLSYSQEQFAIAQGKMGRPPPLIKSFYEPVQLLAQTANQREIDIQKLFKFARHPLRYYLHEKLGIYPEKQAVDQTEFVLDPLTKHKLVQKALKGTLEDRDLPINLLKPLAREQIEKEVEMWSAFGELRTEKIEVEIGGFKLSGKLENLTSKGLLVKGKNCFEDRIRFFPQIHLLEKLGIPVIGIKDQAILTTEGSLEKYLEYFLIAEANPSPLLPDLAKPLLNGTATELKKGLSGIEDEVWNWLLMRDPMPDAEILHRNWSTYLKEVFGGVYAKI